MVRPNLSRVQLSSVRGLAGLWTFCLHCRMLIHLPHQLISVVLPVHDVMFPFQNLLCLPFLFSRQLSLNDLFPPSSLHCFARRLPE